MNVNISLPLIGGISGTWEPLSVESKAAWELYVELITRVAVAPLGPGKGILREALTSFHSLFGTTREILRKYGPEVGPPGRENQVTFGFLSIATLNSLRPLLEEWHPELQGWEETRPNGVGYAEHERAWNRAEELRAVIADARVSLEDLARVLGEVAGSANLIDGPSPDNLGQNERGGGR